MKTILVDAIGTLFVKGKGIDEDMRTLLDTYPNKKIVLTNANDEEMKKFSLLESPYPLFSLKHNPDKTNPKFYETLLKKFELTVQDVVYFEHSLKAVKSARAIGIKSYVYDGSKRDLVNLKDFLDENLE